MVADPLLEGFLRHLRVERGLAENTCLSYGYQAGAYLAFLREQGRDPAIATSTEVLAYLERRKDEGLRSASLFIAAMAMRQFHRYLLRAGLASADPTAGMRLPRFRQRIPDPLDREGMERLLRPPSGGRFAVLRDHAMLELMYTTGMRVSELTGLRMEQVDLRGGWVRVLGKGSKERLVPFGERAATALYRYLNAREARFPTASSILFVNARGRGPITRGSFARRLAAAAQRAGLSGRPRPHQLRHSAATHLIEGGADIRVVQQLLGHASIQTTQSYTHVTTDFLRRECARAHPAFR